MVGFVGVIVECQATNAAPVWASIEMYVGVGPEDLHVAEALAAYLAPERLLLVRQVDRLVMLSQPLLILEDLPAQLAGDPAGVLFPLVGPQPREGLELLLTELAGEDNAGGPVLHLTSV